MADSVFKEKHNNILKFWFDPCKTLSSCSWTQPDPYSEKLGSDQTAFSWGWWCRGIATNAEDAQDETRRPKQLNGSAEQFLLTVEPINDQASPVYTK